MALLTIADVHPQLHGYSPVNYEVPVDSYNNLVDLNSLARRIGRAAGHYLQVIYTCQLLCFPSDLIFHDREMPFTFRGIALRSSTLRRWPSKHGV